MCEQNLKIYLNSTYAKPLATEIQMFDFIFPVKRSAWSMKFLKNAFFVFYRCKNSKKIVLNKFKTRQKNMHFLNIQNVFSHIFKVKQ